MCIVLLASCRENVVDYVNPFVGAASLGHCMPCAASPFGMVQVGPQSGNWSWDYTGGYQYADTTLWGFSQNRINGTGCPDMGDLLMFPFCGEWDRDDYQSTYDKASEKAEPGYYCVYLDEAGVFAEMTAADHSSIARYVYDDPQEARLMIDFQSGIMGDMTSFHHHVIWAEQDFVSPYEIVGKARVRMWVDRVYYYSIRFDSPYQVKEALPLRHEAEKAHRYVLSFDLPKNGELKVKASVSRTSIENAQRNIDSEISGWNFSDVRAATLDKWTDLLERVRIKGTTEQKNIFYSAMYKLFIHPNNVADVGEDVRFSTLSLWDTYRAAHPLYTILAPEKVNDFVRSMLAQYHDEGCLPIWSLWGQENWCMIGNHSVPVIVDAYLKGFRDWDVEKVYEAVKTSLTTPLPKTQCQYYDKYGYYPFDYTVNESVSRTLECCYDDWCAALFAKELGKQEDYEFFLNRSTFWRNVYDSQTGLMRAKDSKGNWREPFDVFTPSHDSTCGGDYTEGNAWQYTWHVQHDVQGLVDLMGGSDMFCAKLDTLFTLEKELSNEGFSSDVSGLIGQYAHGNEPSHHVAYMYAMAGQPHKTQEMIRHICRSQYKDAVDGLCGNDDCGQMSAWYIFSVLGFYPVDPCGGVYILGAPQVPEAEILLPDGKVFRMVAENLSEENLYVEKVELNGKPVEGVSINHNDILSGSELKFYMTDRY